MIQFCRPKAKDRERARTDHSINQLYEEKRDVLKYHLRTNNGHPDGFNYIMIKTVCWLQLFTKMYIVFISFLMQPYKKNASLCIFIFSNSNISAITWMLTLIYEYLSTTQMFNRIKNFFHLYPIITLNQIFRICFFEI